MLLVVRRTIVGGVDLDLKRGRFTTMVSLVSLVTFETPYQSISDIELRELESSHFAKENQGLSIAGTVFQIQLLRHCIIEVPSEEVDFIELDQEKRI